MRTAQKQHLPLNGNNNNNIQTISGSSAPWMADDMEAEPEEGFGAANPSLNQLHDRLHSGFIVAKSRDNRRVKGHVVRASVPSPLAGVDLAKFTTVTATLDTFIPPQCRLHRYRSRCLRPCQHLQSQGRKSVAAKALCLSKKPRINSATR